MKKIVLAVLVSLLGVNAAQGQLVGLNHLWTVAGAMNTTNLGTFIACTNSTTANETVGVDFYGPDGTYVPSLSLMNSATVAPGGTVLFGTSGLSAVSVDVNYAAPLISKGSAKILSTSTKGIICTALLIDISNAAPASIAPLTIVKKTKQKGD